VEGDGAACSLASDEAGAEEEDEKTAVAAAARVAIRAAARLLKLSAWREENVINIKGQGHNEKRLRE
jgi:post-segregation antitoxin (ccd killing protein)